MKAAMVEMHTGGAKTLADEMRTLTAEEIDEVSGGLAPLAFGLAMGAVIYGPPLLALGIAYVQGAFRD